MALEEVQNHIPCIYSKCWSSKKSTLWVIITISRLYDWEICWLYDLGGVLDGLYIAACLNIMLVRLSSIGCKSSARSNSCFLGRWCSSWHRCFQSISSWGIRSICKWFCLWCTCCSVFWQFWSNSYSLCSIEFATLHFENSLRFA